MKILSNLFLFLLGIVIMILHVLVGIAALIVFTTVLGFAAALIARIVAGI